MNRVLVGNKDDDPERKVVLTEDARAFAAQMGIQLFETSAKENKNVEEMFKAVTEQVLRSKRMQREGMDGGGPGGGGGGASRDGYGRDGRDRDGNIRIGPGSGAGGRARPGAGGRKGNRSSCCK